MSLLIRIVFQVYSLLVILKVILSYFVSPYNPFRRILDRLVDPLLSPIKRIIPPIGNWDFSPIILLLLLQLLERILLSVI